MISQPQKFVVPIGALGALLTSRLWRRGCRGEKDTTSERPAHSVAIRVDCAHVIAPRRQS
jgi:hypothetical protein